MEEIIVRYAAVILIIFYMIFRSRIFVTKEELRLEKDKLFEEAKREFLAIVAFNQFEKRMEDRFQENNKRFDRIDENMQSIREGIDNMRDLLIKMKQQ